MNNCLFNVRGNYSLALSLTSGLVESITENLVLLL